MELIPEAERPHVHRFIGSRLLETMTLEDQVDTYIYEICTQLNKARDHLTLQEREELIRLNLRAGEMALKGSAVEGANDYYQVAMELLGDNPWRERRELALEVYYGNIIRLDAAVQYDEGNSV